MTKTDNARLAGATPSIRQRPALRVTLLALASVIVLSGLAVAGVLAVSWPAATHVPQPLSHRVAP